MPNFLKLTGRNGTPVLVDMDCVFVGASYPDSGFYTLRTTVRGGNGELVEVFVRETPDQILALLVEKEQYK